MGSSFATAAASAAGLQPVLEQLNRGLMTFSMVLTGGGDWKNGEGSGVVMADDALQLDSESAKLAFEHGARVGKLAAVTAANFAPTPSPQPSVHGPPPFGENWSAIVTANMTQVGYDAGLVIVNFTSSCGADPGQQKAKTVYGDFDTVLTRCDLGKEFIIRYTRHCALRWAENFVKYKAALEKCPKDK